MSDADDGYEGRTFVAAGEDEPREFHYVVSDRPAQHGDGGTLTVHRFSRRHGLVGVAERDRAAFGDAVAAGEYEEVDDVPDAATEDVDDDMLPSGLS